MQLPRFYDHVHTTGLDVPQAPYARAALTLGWHLRRPNRHSRAQSQMDLPGPGAEHTRQRHAVERLRTGSHVEVEQCYGAAEHEPSVRQAAFRMRGLGPGAGCSRQIWCLPLRLRKSGVPKPLLWLTPAEAQTLQLLEPEDLCRERDRCCEDRSFSECLLLRGCCRRKFVILFQWLSGSMSGH